jgi:dTDP-4-amino-4,6-dideoxygalactose transaminase
MGLTHLERFDVLMAANAATVAAYRRGLDGVAGITPLEIASHVRSNDQYVVTLVDEETAGISRDDVMRVLRAENVLAKSYFHPGCHRLDPLAAGADGAVPDLPVTERLARSVLVLPGGASIDAADVADVCRLLGLILGHGPELAAALPAAI